MNSSADYTLILSGDSLILFEHIDEQKAKIVFGVVFMQLLIFR